MGSLSSEKTERLALLLSSLPAGLVDRLLSVADEADPALARMLRYCVMGPDASARAALFEPFTAVTGDPAHDMPSRVIVAEPVLPALWTWLSEDLAPEAIAQVHDAVQQFDAPRSPGALDPVRADVGRAIIAALDEIDQEPKAQKKLRQRLGVSDFQPFRRVASLLAASEAIRTALDGLPDVIDDMPEALSAEIRDRYEAAAESNPDAGVWVLMMILPRFEKPWRLLRAFERIAKREDDFLLSRTDMSSVGDALLDDAEFHLRGFSAPPLTSAAVATAIDSLTRFAAVTVGMTREIGIRKDGAWGKRLFALRSAASDQMAQVHEAAKQAFRQALPEHAPRRYGAKSPPQAGEPEFDEAMALGEFLYRTKDDASRAAVGNAHSQLLEELRDMTEQVALGVLERIRAGTSSDPEGDHGRLQDVVQLMEVLGDGESGALLLRRAAAAKAA